jgi:Asp-tRNA(Asn)/Glu-tRNA(Gln) amidotransferase A subunit family amidase
VAFVSDFSRGLLSKNQQENKYRNRRHSILYHSFFYLPSLHLLYTPFSICKIPYCVFGIPTMASSSATSFQNWPDAVESKIPYKAPPKGSNPAVKGFILGIGAPLVGNLGFVSQYLYNNAGFNKLRKLKELKDIKHRFDPTVIPIATDAEKSEGPLNYTDPSVASQSLLKTPETPVFYSIRDYHEAFKSGKLTPTIVAKALLPLVRRDVPNRSVHSTAFLTTQVEIVLAAAEASTKRWAEGKPLGLLDGVPLAIKDEVDLAGYKQTYGSKHTFRESKETSWCVVKWEEAGAVIIGKTTMHEIGMDTTNNNPTHGTPLNPYNDSYYTGGSSGGSGYAVATGLVPVALGCDGGGSIRIPANYCGIFGLKTSHSRVSTHPSPDFAGTTAVAGPMAADMDSLALAWRVMATPDPHVSSSALFPQPKPLSAPRKKVIGIFRPWYDNSDAPVKSACDATLEYLKTTHGYEVVDIALPLVSEGQLAHALTILLEVYNGLDSLSFLQPANKILMSVASRAQANDFLSAQKVRQIVMQHLAHLYDVHGRDLIIVTPTTPNAGWSHTKADLKKGISDGDKTIRTMQYVWMANFTGNPAISCPVGYVAPTTGTGKIPVGLMGMGIWGGEEGLIDFGFEVEKYLHEVLEGGRLKSPVWVDVIKVATEPEKKEEVVEEKPKTNGVHPEEKKVETEKAADVVPNGESKEPEVAVPVPEKTTEEKAEAAPVKTEAAAPTTTEAVEEKAVEPTPEPTPEPTTTAAAATVEKAETVPSTETKEPASVPEKEIIETKETAIVNEEKTA